VPEVPDPPLPDVDIPPDPEPPVPGDPPLPFEPPLAPACPEPPDPELGAALEHAAIAKQAATKENRRDGRIEFSYYDLSPKSRQGSVTPTTCAAARPARTTVPRPVDVQKQR
jgi:hypothetical protein